LESVLNLPLLRLIIMLEIMGGLIISSMSIILGKREIRMGFSHDIK